MTHNQPGNFSFLGAPGRPFSAGVRADDGFDIVHAVLTRPLPLPAGFDLARSHLEMTGRPVQALCGMELRIPAPLSPDGFAEFNRRYVEVLDSWALPVDGMLPPARTNVAPADGSVREPSLFAFSFTVQEPALDGAFLMSGAPEAEHAGDPAGARLASIVEVLRARTASLGVGLDRVTAVNFYAEQPWATEVAEVLLPAFGAGAPTVQLTWVAARPPVTPYQLEVDVRRCGKEVALDTGSAGGS